MKQVILKRVGNETVVTLYLCFPSPAHRTLACLRPLRLSANIVSTLPTSCQFLSPQHHYLVHHDASRPRSASFGHVPEHRLAMTSALEETAHIRSGTVCALGDEHLDWTMLLTPTMQRCRQIAYGLERIPSGSRLPSRSEHQRTSMSTSLFS